MHINPRMGSIVFFVILGHLESGHTASADSMKIRLDQGYWGYRLGTRNLHSTIPQDDTGVGLDDSIH